MGHWEPLRKVLGHPAKSLRGGSSLPIVREACESTKYNAIVLLGGEPGYQEPREIARRYGIPVTSCAFSQMDTDSMPGNKFRILNFAESHNMF